tara:strand:- start:351 stop:791 length:441 start_codon:yes stop_codon:yes gene_type:complete
MYKIIDPTKESLFEEYLYLRWLLLRRPLGGKRGTEIDDLENKSFHRAIVDQENNIFGVGRIHFINNIGQIRYMAIKKEFSRMGYGSILIDSLEKIGLDKKVGNFFLNSRINAISFYKKNGYEKINKVSPSFGEIVHYRMEKILDNR